MKDSLFELLFNLFEKTLDELKQAQLDDKTQAKSVTEQHDDCLTPLIVSKDSVSMELVKEAHKKSIRVLTADERMKLTKASYQFLMRMLAWDVIDASVLELTINHLLLSDSRFVSLQETKWALRGILAETMSAEELAFLDLVLYHNEDGYVLH